jgi:NAD(P)-dependent dehydrogenase (short-subunit alcohol dehydrogenase family)
VVTGGGRGIGAAVCRQAAAAGYSVVVNYTAAADRAAALVEELTGTGARAVAVRADVADEAAVGELFAAADELGTVVALVNNAGITGPYGRFDAVATADLRRVLDVNVLGAMLCTRAAVRRMSTRYGGAGGCVVNVSSRAAVLGGAHEWVHYAASKGALDSLTVGLANELAGDGIRVNGVAPGLIDTEVHAAAGQPDRLARMAPGVPLGRPGEAAEVAAAVLWLMSAQAAFVTAATLPVSGGR